MNNRRVTQGVFGGVLGGSPRSWKRSLRIYVKPRGKRYESGAIHLLEEGANSRGGEGVGGKDAEVLEEAEGAFGFVDGDEFGHGAESLGWLGSGGERRERGFGRGRGWSGLGRKVGGKRFGW